mmetsp:Transcript_39127/g.80133  ORF Transcript_39127/g.80133 Transcript_39127/m.80133 type:complete len:255 (+) Transcript_39127:75-839(+)
MHSGIVLHPQVVNHLFYPTVAGGFLCVLECRRCSLCGHLHTFHVNHTRITTICGNGGAVFVRANHPVGDHRHRHEAAQRVHRSVVQVRRGVQRSGRSEHQKLADRQCLGGQQLRRRLDGCTESLQKLLGRDLGEQISDGVFLGQRAQVDQHVRTGHSGHGGEQQHAAVDGAHEFRAIQVGFVRWQNGVHTAHHAHSQGSACAEAIHGQGRASAHHALHEVRQEQIQWDRTQGEEHERIPPAKRITHRGPAQSTP